MADNLFRLTAFPKCFVSSPCLLLSNLSMSLNIPQKIQRKRAYHTNGKLKTDINTNRRERSFQRELNLKTPLPVLSSQNSPATAPHSNQGNHKFQISRIIISSEQRHHQSKDILSSELLYTNVTVLLRDNIFLGTKEEKRPKTIEKAFLLK